jgi:hypothetical protein
MKKLLLITATIILILNCNAQVDSMYFGQTPAGIVPVQFAPGIITGYVHGTLAISPKGDEIYWVINPSTERIMYSKFDNGIWKEPALADFVKDFLTNNNGNPTFSPDGEKLFFYSDRPGGLGNYDSWYVERTDSGWSKPVNAGAPYNTADADLTPLFTNKGNAYHLGYNNKHEEITSCYKYSNNKFTDPTPMDILSEYGPWWTLYISPEEEYVIFAGDDTPNLYIRFKNDKNKWGNPINMGSKINTAEDERFPVVSPDGKYLFFIRGEGTLNNYYWVFTSIIDDLRNEASKYLGQTPPGDSAVMFAPGIISKTNSHGTLVISPDGKEIFWNVANFDTYEGKIYSVIYSNGKWSDPKIPSFSTIGIVTNVVFSPNGKKLFFEYRDDANSSWTIKYVEKTDSGWSKPKSDGLLVSTSSSFTTTGKVYYSDTYAKTPWGGGIYSANYSETGLSNIQLLPEIINTTDIVNYTPYIATDESYLLFSSNRPLKGGNDTNMYLYISFNNNGIWSTPQKINNAINFTGKARLPSISPDGKYLFFCGDDRNFYWVDIKALKKLKPTSIGKTQKSNFEFSIFPNPTSGQFTLSLGTFQNQKSLVEIYNLQGTQVFSKTFQNTTYATIDLTRNSAGIYMVKVIAGGACYEEKIMKE